MSDTEPTVERLLARIESLEKTAKSQRWIGLIAFLAVFLVIAQSQFQSRMGFVADSVRTGSVITGSIALQNAAGEIVGLFAPGNDGMPQLSFFDANKKVRLSIGLQKDGGPGNDGTPQLSLFDANKKARLGIGLRPDGGPSISLSDPDNVVRAVLSLNEHQDPSLVLSDSATLPHAIFSVTDSSGTASLTGTKGGIWLSAFDGKMTWNPKEGGAQEIQLAK